jgi:glutamate synthase domain-containing protein 2/glutamate synthase domain-containing protein 1/glutamate synthase domain-containing protein 3
MGSLYDPAFEHDACGVGFVANVAGQASHGIVQQALTAVINLMHRGAIDADAKTGDGAGLLTQLPRKLFVREAARLGLPLGDPADLGVGMIFLPQSGDRQAAARAIIENAIDFHGVRILGWRAVPVDDRVLGDKARSTQPAIWQILVARPDRLARAEFEQTLYLIRKDAEGRLIKAGIDDCYVPSFSHRTIVYKGLFVAPQLRGFYADLTDADFESALAVFHQRYATNTFPDWYRAQPFRMLAHNGEINTLQGNRNWLRAREAELRAPVWGDRVALLHPIIWEGGSDSASLDNALELLTVSGRDIRHSMMMLQPEPWENMDDMSPAMRGFFEYHACITEPWDGPAGLAWTDGVIVGASLDRNGLRPSRYKLTRNGVLVVASEVGALPIDDADVAEKGRLGPGQMIAVDTAAGRLYHNGETKNQMAARRPYGEWVKRSMCRLDHHAAHAAQHGTSAANGHSHANGYVPLVLLRDGKAPRTRTYPADELRAQRAFGLTSEEIGYVVRPMGEEGKDATWSMGDDTPLAVLATRNRLLYSYFKQRFAQVTNPPIDPLRETMVMSLFSYLGPRGSMLEEDPEFAHLVHLTSPLLSEREYAALVSLTDARFAHCTLDTTFDAAGGTAALGARLDELCQEAIDAVDRGCSLLTLSDRAMDATRAPIPALLAVAAVHHGLIAAGRRMRADLIVETGEAWEIHHIALLIGYGAGAVYPYLAFRLAGGFAGTRDMEDVPASKAMANYRKSVEAGLLKIMSKMGISTISAYRGAQIFEAIGLERTFVAKHFTGTASSIGGVGLEQIAADTLARHAEAYAEEKPTLPDHGLVRFRKEGEYHAFNPSVVKALHKASHGGTYEDYREFMELVHKRTPVVLRDLLRFREAHAIPVADVEPVENIFQRFISTAMSLGALSPRAYTTLSMAMNKLGARSNSGEGGENPDWYTMDGPAQHSKVKQVASARFGVTAEYLSRAEELEIKMAQGSKPGEGGQLPGMKNNRLIARFRHAIPGIALISPPPHHDIYSIEDLAQLIYDLKMVNPRARIGVKLVAESGVGTIAAGVAKAYADYILISGHEGGTGASPLSSIKNAGIPWEIGIAEAQQTLVLNDLRGRVRLRTDGGLKTGRDVVIAALFGAEEYGFGTAAVVAIGCDMARMCHLNTCPTGVATQDPRYIEKFTGTVDMVINYFTYVAREVRETLASLGLRSLDEAIGRADLLEQYPRDDHERDELLNLSPLLARTDGGTRPLRHIQERNVRHEHEPPLDDRILADAAAALDGHGPVALSYPIRNANRTVGARLAGEIGLRYGAKGLPDASISLHFEGSAGQSFGAFCTNGMAMHLVGEANDYVGKGMSGGEIVVTPRENVPFAPHKNTIAGNTVLYGATGGTMFVHGRAGERFCVRNSGAHAVVEGVGDHGCEYMTAGVVVVLGETGRNFGAGMSNGTAYVLDEGGHFERKYNPELVCLSRVSVHEDLAQLKSLIERHGEKTGSERARYILAAWDHYLPLFWKLAPKSIPDVPPSPEEERQLSQDVTVGELPTAVGVAG